MSEGDFVGWAAVADSKHVAGYSSDREPEEHRLQQRQIHFVFDISSVSFPSLPSSSRVEIRHLVPEECDLGGRC